MFEMFESCHDQKIGYNDNFRELSILISGVVNVLLVYVAVGGVEEQNKLLMFSPRY